MRVLEKSVYWARLVNDIDMFMLSAFPSLDIREVFGLVNLFANFGLGILEGINALLEGIRL
jgi:hypothetical protein